MSSAKKAKGRESDDLMGDDGSSNRPFSKGKDKNMPNVLVQKLVSDLKDPTNTYLAAVFLTGVVQFVYLLLVGTFPFNAFLAGFLSCVTSFVLGVCLKKTGEFKGFLFAHLVLHLAVLMLIG